MITTGPNDIQDGGGVIISPSGYLLLGVLSVPLGCNEVRNGQVSKEEEEEEEEEGRKEGRKEEEAVNPRHKERRMEILWK